MSKQMHEPTLEEVVAFLNGSAPLRGVFFSEKPLGETGAFWWRKHLLSAMARRSAEVEALRADAERYRWLRANLVGRKRSEFFEPLRQHFYDVDEKYPDAADIQEAIDAARGAK